MMSEYNSEFVKSNRLLSGEDASFCVYLIKQFKKLKLKLLSLSDIKLNSFWRLPSIIQFLKSAFSRSKTISWLSFFISNAVLYLNPLFQ